MRRIQAVLSLGGLLLVGLGGTAAAQTRTTVSVRLVDALSTGSSQPNDSFTATLASPLVVNDRIAAEKDARVTGQVREVVPSGRLSGPALITLRLKAVEAPTGWFPMETGDLTIKASSHAARNLIIIGGTAGLGAAIGGGAGGGKGAAIGAVAGAGAGTAGAYLTGKREIVLPSETLLTFHVDSVTISPKELSRLQPAGQGAGSAQQSSDTGPVVVRRRHHGEDEDEDEEEHEHEHRHAQGRGRGHEDEREYEHEDKYEHPETIEVIFHRGRQAGVVIRWPGRVERLTLNGDDLDDILEPLAKHTRVSVEFLRPRIRVRREDD